MKHHMALLKEVWQNHDHVCMFLKNKKYYPKYSGLVPLSIQQLWYRKAPVDVRTSMSNESVCQVSRSWVDVGSFHTRLFGIVYVTYDDFHDASEKEQRVCIKFFANVGKRATETLTMIQQTFGDKVLSRTQVFP
jgi:hypothetical protein